MPNPTASSPVAPHVLTLFQEELARAAAMPGLAPAGPALWPRFAGYYQGLTRLPRRLRRALQRRWRRSLGGIALLCALGQAPALAATINLGGGCTLVDAITAANSDAPAGGCSAGSGADTIELPRGSTPLTTALPVITSNITIQGQRSGDESCSSDSTRITRDSSAPEFGILRVGSTGNLTLECTTVSGGAATFGAGISNSGILTLNRSIVSGNTAGYSGGGIFNSGILTLYLSIVSGNRACYADCLLGLDSYGGGIL